MFRALILLLVNSRCADAGTRGYELTEQNKNIIFQKIGQGAWKVNAADVGFARQYHQIKAPLFQVPNAYVGTLNSAYYLLRYWTSIMQVVGECFFFDSTACI